MSSNRRGRLVQKSISENLQSYWFIVVFQAQILLIRQNLKFKIRKHTYSLFLPFLSPLHVRSMASFRFQNILNRKLVIIFIPIPKTRGHCLAGRVLLFFLYFLLSRPNTGGQMEKMVLGEVLVTWTWIFLISSGRSSVSILHFRYCCKASNLHFIIS